MPKPRTPVRRQARPLNIEDRIHNYRQQTGRKTLTPKQNRRQNKKWSRQTRGLRNALKG